MAVGEFARYSYTFSFMANRVANSREVFIGRKAGFELFMSFTGLQKFLSTCETAASDQRSQSGSRSRVLPLYTFRWPNF